MNLARVNPDGFVAQRFDDEFNGRGNWLLMSVVNGNLQASVHTDEDVRSWAQLFTKPSDQRCPRECGRLVWVDGYGKDMSDQFWCPGCHRHWGGHDLVADDRGAEL